MRCKTGLSLRWFWLKKELLSVDITNTGLHLTFILIFRKSKGEYVSKFYTAKNDLVFKTIMISKPKILKKIIESVLEEEVEEIHILNT